MPEVVAPNGMTALDKSRSLVLIADGKLGTRANFPRNTLNDPAPGFSPEDTKILQTMIALGIETNLKILEVRSLRHRHHGLWYDLRSIMTASLLLLALVRSGNGALIPGGLEARWPAPALFRPNRSHRPFEWRCGLIRDRR